MIVIAVARNPHLRFLSRAPASHPLRRGAAPMGQEVVCFAELGGHREKGRALLETSEIVFRGASRKFRLKIPFAKIHSARAFDGELRLKTPDGEAVFTLGAAAEKWLEKIKNPKPRLDKLGVKPGASVALVGSFEPGFLDELHGRTRATSSPKSYHRKRRDCRRTQGRPQGRQSRRLLPNPHRAQVCHSIGATLIRDPQRDKGQSFVYRVSVFRTKMTAWLPSSMCAV